MELKLPRLASRCDICSQVLLLLTLECSGYSESRIVTVVNTCVKLNLRLRLALVGRVAELHDLRVKKHVTELTLHLHLPLPLMG